MSFLRPQLLPANNVLKIIERLNQLPAVDYSVAALADEIHPPPVPRRDPHRQNGRQRQHATRPRRTQSGDDDADGEGDADEVDDTVTDLNNLPALLTVEETAAILRTTTNAIYTMASRAKLPGAVHIGRRLLVRRSEFLHFLNEGRVPPPARSR